MKKKILIVGTISILMLLTTSFVSVVGTTSDSDEAKESPLFKVRNKQALGEKINNVLESIKIKFFGERMYFNSPLVFRFFKPALLTTAQWTDCHTIGCKC